MDRGKPVGGYGGSVLDVYGRVLWHRALHGDEHAEQHAHAQRV